jgi:hypothetical protein
MDNELGDKDVYLVATTHKFAQDAVIDYLTKQYDELHPEKDDLLIENREAYIETFTIDITELPLIDVDLLENPICLDEDAYSWAKDVARNLEEVLGDIHNHLLQDIRYQQKLVQTEQALRDLYCAAREAAI